MKKKNASGQRFLVSKKELNALPGIKCSHCGFRILYKKRPDIIKRLKSETKKGMDVAQVTGASSSYARKYALSGLFAINDGEDIDSKDNTSEGVKSTTTPVKMDVTPSSTKEDEVDGRILFVGRIVPIKAIENLIHALNIVKNEVPTVHLNS